VLDELHKYLYLVATASFDHIDSLHEHRIKKRSVIIAENPGLHLVWYHDTIFIKPIPPILLNFKIWKEFLLPEISSKVSGSEPQTGTGKLASYTSSDLNPLCKQALGFLRTYALLVRHTSDFEIAQKLGLIPSTVPYLQFQSFIKPFLSLPEDTVSARYHYGQLRLTRLIWALRILQPRSKKGGWPT
jgi:hypothetical protein